MTIDIQPTTKLATDKGLNLAIDIYNVPIYCIEKEDGTQFTATFTPDQFANFCPSKTVSEMLSSWETDTTGKLQFVKYTYDPELKIFPLMGKLIPVVAKRDTFHLCKKVDQVHVQSILYDTRTLLVNDLWGWVENGKVQTMISRPYGVAEDVPVGTVFEHPESKNKAVKMFDAVYAEVGSHKSLSIVTPKGSYPSSMLMGNISKYFDKVSS